MTKIIRQALRLYNRVEELKQLHRGKELDTVDYWAGLSLGRDQGALSVIEENMSNDEYIKYDNIIKLDLRENGKLKNNYDN